MAHYRLTLSRVDSIATAALRADPDGPSANQIHRLITEVRDAVAVESPIRLPAAPVADGRWQPGPLVKSSEARLAHAR